MTDLLSKFIMRLEENLSSIYLEGMRLKNQFSLKAKLAMVIRLLLLLLEEELL